MANWDLLNEKDGLEKNDLGHDVGEKLFLQCKMWKWN